MRNFYFHSKVNKYAKNYILFLDLAADISQRKKPTVIHGISTSLE